jgi:tRNA (cytidine32/uridine32-2'-O)-methyltransferase
MNTSHPGNIGATARAMKTMGFQQLTLIAPKHFPHPEAEALAVSAKDILQQARVVNTLDEALQGMTCVIGTSARQRDLAAPLLSSRECGAWIKQQGCNDNIAFLFGEERTGLTNEALDRCHAYVHIDTDKACSALNLAQAVQVITYELRQALFINQSIESGEKTVPFADDAALEGYFQQLERVMIKTEFLDPQFPKRLMSRLKRLYHRAKPDIQELNILRGILTSVEKKISE